jgi:hypothetical protein
LKTVQRRKKGVEEGMEQTQVQVRDGISVDPLTHAPDLLVPVDLPLPLCNLFLGSKFLDMPMCKTTLSQIPQVDIDEEYRISVCIADPLTIFEDHWIFSTRKFVRR